MRGHLSLLSSSRRSVACLGFSVMWVHISEIFFSNHLNVHFSKKAMTHVLVIFNSSTYFSMHRMHAYEIGGSLVHSLRNRHVCVGKTSITSRWCLLTGEGNQVIV